MGCSTFYKACDLAVICYIFFRFKIRSCDCSGSSASFSCSVARISRLCCCIPQNDSFQACPYAFKAIKEDGQQAHTPAHTSSSLAHTHVRSQIDMYVLVSDSAASYYNSSLIFNFQCISLRAFSLFALRFSSSFCPLVFCSHFLPGPLAPCPGKFHLCGSPSHPAPVRVLPGHFHSENSLACINSPMGSLFWQVQIKTKKNHTHTTNKAQ